MDGVVVQAPIFQNAGQIIMWLRVLRIELYGLAEQIPSFVQRFLLPAHDTEVKVRVWIIWLKVQSAGKFCGSLSQLRFLRQDGTQFVVQVGALRIQFGGSPQLGD